MTKVFYEKELSAQVLQCAYTVYSALGPGLLESTYQACLAYELEKIGLKVMLEKPLPIIYQDVKLEVGYRIDLLVENTIILELKSVDALAEIHKAQLLTYLKLSGIKVGYLMNFNVMRLKEGIVRMVL